VPLTGNVGGSQFSNVRREDRDDLVLGRASAARC
jgi:hypothetical protein